MTITSILHIYYSAKLPQASEPKFCRKVISWHSAQFRDEPFCSNGSLSVSIHSLFDSLVNWYFPKHVTFKKLNWKCFFWSLLLSIWMLLCLPATFRPYKFELRQFITNDEALQTTIDTFENCQTSVDVRLPRIIWDRKLGTFSPGKIWVDTQANTKRSILATLKNVYAFFNIHEPISNRARLFFKKLHEDKSVSWDSSLSEPLKKEWKLITKQINSTPRVPIPRFIGRRYSSYALVTFSDARKDIYGKSHIYYWCQHLWDKFPYG